ncbi:MAG: flagellar biosynthetic protein FliO [Ignavibacteriales bacterium]|nr:flagellar biosynthetic protein FliO [Ignavibacteriales bacterium]
MEFALVKTIFSLIAVLGLMVVVLLAVKKFSHIGSGSRANLVDIEVLSQKVLQPKRMLYVVKVLNKVLVISSTEQGIQPVGEIDDAAVVLSLEARQESARDQKESSFVSFKQRLRTAETLGDFFHKPFNVILWRGDKPGIASSVDAGKVVHS